MHPDAFEGPVRVLLVDDDEEDYLITRDLFSEIEHGRYALQWIAEFDPALTAICSQQFEICLVDYHLGARTGLDLVQDAKRLGSRTPLILMTGLGDHEIDLQAMRAGAADFLVKGQIQPESLDRSLRYALERKRAEDKNLSLEAQLRQAQKMEAIGQLAAGVAHDFNNLLTVIQGHTNLLQTTLQSHSDATKWLGRIALAADRAGKLVKQLLTVSRKQVLQPEHLDLNEIISNFSKMLQRVLGEDIVLLAPQTAGLPAVHADTGMIEQVLMNLAVNARDAMPRGGKLTITTEAITLSEADPRKGPAAKPGSFVCLSVSDTGCGMDPAIVPRIFDPFFTTKQPGKGTGLGLTTVYSIVQQHHGWIDLQTEVGRGTSFRIYVPAVWGKPRSSTVVPGPVRAARGTETVLVVEDEMVVRELAVEILRLHGYRVRTAESGAQALEHWKQYRAEVDLLLTDMVMPGGISGPELARRLVQSKPGLCVIYTSGYSPGIAGKDLTLMSEFNFLPKPYPPARLASLVRECLDRRASATAQLASAPKATHPGPALQPA